MVMATIDRTKFNGIVSTSDTVNGAGMSSTIVFNAQSEGSGVAILQLSENALDFGEQETAMTFQVRNIGTNSSVLDWTISTPAVNWLTISPMSGSTGAGNASLVTGLIAVLVSCFIERCKSADKDSVFTHEMQRLAVFFRKKKVA